MKIKFLPIIKMLCVEFVVAISIILINSSVNSIPKLSSIIAGSSWILATLVHVPQFLLPFLMILYLSKGRLEQYGFNLNESLPFFTRIRMLKIGVIFGSLLSLKYIPQIITSKTIDIPRPIQPVNILGSLVFQWVVVGLCEETMFRGLIQTYLMDNLQGYVRLFRHDLHIGTVIGALFWGAFHFINILVMPWNSTLLTVFLTTIAGLLMGYAYQETRSLSTTIIIHITLFGIPLLIGYFIYFLFL